MAGCSRCFCLLLFALRQKLDQVLRKPSFLGGFASSLGQRLGRKRLLKGESPFFLVVPRREAVRTEVFCRQLPHLCPALQANNLVVLNGFARLSFRLGLIGPYLLGSTPVQEDSFFFS